jgi:hypothetical protein
MTRGRVALACAGAAATLALAGAPAASASTTACTYTVLARVLGTTEPSCSTGYLYCPAYAICTATTKLTARSLVGVLGRSAGRVLLQDSSLFGGSKEATCTGPAKGCTAVVSLTTGPDFDGGVWRSTCHWEGAATNLLATVTCTMTLVVN